MAASALLACERAAVAQPTVALIYSLSQARKVATSCQFDISFDYLYLIITI